MKENFTYEQVQAVLERYKQCCDPAEQSCYMEELLKFLRPLIIKKVLHYFGRADEDLIQDGYLRAMELIEAFDMERGIRFLGYMQRMLGCFFFDKRKAAVKTENQCSFQEEYMEPEEDVNFSNIESADLLTILNEKEKVIILKNVIQKYKLVEVSEQLDISYAYAKEVKRNALLKLRKNLQPK